jgi:alpha/beta superfamily hydrolase
VRATEARALALLFIATTALGCRTITPAARPSTLEPRPSPSSPQASVRENAERFEAILHALDEGRFSAIESTYDDALSAALPAGKLHDVWQSIERSLGRMISWHRLAVESSRAQFVLRFSSGTARLTLAMTARGKLTGIFVANPQAFAPCGDGSLERQLEIGAAPPVGGTLVVPVGAVARVPAVLLLAGSGPLDQDGTVGANKPLRDIACALADRGIASLRFDKRSFAAAASLHEPLTVDDEIGRDARAALQLLAADSAVDAKRIVIVGHSTGAMIAPELARRSSVVAAVALLAPPARDVGDAILGQLRHLHSDPETIASTQRALSRIRDGSAPDGERLLGASAHYWRDLFRIDAPRDLMSTNVSAVLVFGGCDYQVTEADARIWRERLDHRAATSIITFADINHLMIANCATGQPADYEVRGRVAPRVIDVIEQLVRGSPTTLSP